MRGSFRRTLVLAAGTTVVLFGTSTALSAQQVPQGAISPATSGVAGSLQAPNAENAPPGSIPKPTMASPGTVAGVTLGEIYTNNVQLAASGEAKSSSFITQVEPFFRAARSGRRFSGMIDYSLFGYLYRGQTHQHQVAQNLHGTGTFTLLPKHFFVDGVASYERAIVNNQLPSSSSAYFLTNNQANTAVGILSPYWEQDLGALGSMTLRYSRGRVVYNEAGISGQTGSILTGVPDATSNGVQFGLTSPPQGLWRWDAGYARQRIEPDFGPGSEFASAKLGVGLQVSRTTELLADAGKENRFEPDGTVQGLGARFWDAGFRWSDTLNKFEVLVGHHFYGASYFVSWTHEAARVATTLSYSEQPTDVNQTLLTRNPTQQILLPLTVPRVPSLSELQPYLSKRASASIAYTGARDKLSVTVYDERRAYFSQDNTPERVLDAESSWQFQLGVFTMLTPTFRWQRYEFLSGQFTYRYLWQLALVHQFGLKNIGRIALSNDESNVNDPVPGAHGYQARAVLLEWIHLF